MTSTQASENMNKKSPWEEVCSPERIVDILIRIRLKDAQKRHDAHFERNISARAPRPSDVVPGTVDHLLPPRTSWHRPKMDGRNGQSREDVAVSAIRRSTLGHMRAGALASFAWGRELAGFIKAVQSVVWNPSGYEMDAPGIALLSKGGKKDVFRIVSSYRRLLDRVVISLVSGYLRDAFDELLIPNVYGFRPGTESTHHHAVRALCEYRAAHAGGEIHVGECDIQKFFDTVSHASVLAAYDEAESLIRNQGGAVDSRARDLTEAYLRSYSFPGVGLPAARKQLAGMNKGCRLDHLPDQQLAALENRVGPIGIPQGGALSTVTANLVLAKVDRAVVGVAGAEDLFYARYCDDMVVAHPERRVCTEALDRYLEAIRGLGLVAHTPETPNEYGAAFFAAKSKTPYRWADPDPAGPLASPWVSFLGYQVKCDGTLRIRPESWRKAHDGIVELTTRVCTLIKRSDGRLRKNARAVCIAVEGRMICESTGRLDLRAEQGSGVGMSWADGFQLLSEYPHAEHQLKKLDRTRERQLRRLKARLVRCSCSVSAPKLPGSVEKDFGYKGAPYSYHGRFGHASANPDYRKQSLRSVYG